MVCPAGSCFSRQRPPVFATADLFDGADHRNLIDTLAAGRTRLLPTGIDAISRAMFSHDSGETSAQLGEVENIVSQVCPRKAIEFTPTVWWLGGDAGCSWSSWSARRANLPRHPHADPHPPSPLPLGIKPSLRRVAGRWGN